MSRPTRVSKRLVAIVFLSVSTFVAFVPVLSNGFVSYDDGEYVTENVHVQAGMTGAGVRWAWTTFHAANWHPVAWLSHMIDWEIYGSNPVGHHLTSLLLHVANTLLLFQVLHLATGSLERSATVAALFGVHPLHVESVAWVSERKDVLSTLFWMLATWAYVRYARRPTLGGYLAVAALLGVGLCTKPMLVTLPLVFLLLDYWPLGRWNGGGTASPSADGRRLAVMEKVPLLILSAASAVVTLLAQRAGDAMKDLADYPFSSRVANAIVSYAAYLEKTVWPVHLGVFYPHPLDATSSTRVASAAVLLAAVTALAVRARRSRPYVPVGWLWYVGTLVPVIGLVQVGDQGMADRYMYVPVIGIFVIVVWGFADVVAVPRALKLALAVIAILALGARTWVQAGTWRDSVTLFSHAIAVTGPNAMARENLSVALLDQGRAQEAIEQYRETIRIFPELAEAHRNLGLALTRIERGDEAIPEYRRALALDPDDIAARNGLGLALAERGQLAEATAQFSAAVKIGPGDAASHDNLGMALAAVGRTSEAIEQFRDALRLDPDDARVHDNLGMALAGEGKIDEAREHFVAAVRLRRQKSVGAPVRLFDAKP